MITASSNPTDALTFLLRGLYDAELRLQKAMPLCIGQIASGTLRTLFDKYYESAVDRVLTLQHVFSHLMASPEGGINEVVDRIVGDAQSLLQRASSNQARDIVLASCIQSINHYKISGYRTALGFALELELSDVAGLVSRILDREREAVRGFAHFDIDEGKFMLEGRTVRDVLMRDVPLIDDNATMKDAASRLLNGNSKNFLVLHDGNPVGVVTRQDILQALRTYGEKASVRNAVDEHLEYLSLAMPLHEAWSKMQQDHKTMMLVIDEGQVKGAIDEESIEQLILLHTAQSKN